MQLGAETELDYWSLGCPPAGLGGTSAGLQPGKLDFCSKMEPNCLVMDEASGVVYLEVSLKASSVAGDYKSQCSRGRC